MKNKINNELRQLNQEQLLIKLEEFRRELFRLRLAVATSHVKSFPSLQRLLRKNIARVQTILQEKSY